MTTFGYWLTGECLCVLCTFYDFALLATFHSEIILLQFLVIVGGVVLYYTIVSSTNNLTANLSKYEGKYLLQQLII